jgi:hypothetical protein
MRKPRGNRLDCVNGVAIEHFHELKLEALTATESSTLDFSVGIKLL